MSVSRIKSLIIVALVFLNTFFLVIILIDNNADAREARQAIESVCEIFRLNGITINPDSIKSAGDIHMMRTAREVELEADIAQLFLGEFEMTDQSVIYLYENIETGTAEFYSAGDFEVRLHEGVITYTNDARQKVQELLASIQPEKFSFDIHYDETNETVNVISIYDNVKIFNSTIDFVFSGNSLRLVEGRYVTGIETMESGTKISNAGTALLSFLSAIRNGDIDCIEVFSVEAGYLHSVVGSFGDGVIVPVWMVTTNEGRYAVDSASGEIRFI